ncbi:MAG: outer membrane beta-barrel protein [Lewinella sp.]|nr:outer membrane beta-barrel protein [Lewinella sp.]
MIKPFQPGWLALGLMLSLFPGRTCTAQENYLPGRIITLQGDTLKGLIDYRNWKNTPQKVGFRKSENSEKTVYQPLDIRGFAVSDEIYESAIVEVETSPFKANELKAEKDLIMGKDTTFLQSMVIGPKSLLYYKGIYGNEQFYIRRDGQIELLVYKRYLKTQNGKKGIGENLKFLGQLTHYFQDCPSIQSRIKNTIYRKKSLESLFEAYYKCSGDEIAFQKKSEKLALKGGVFAGLSRTTLKFKGGTRTNSSGSSPSIDLSGGLSLDLIFPRTFQKWIFRNELQYYSYNTEESYKDPTIIGGYNSTIINKFGFSYLKLNTMARFKFPVKKAFGFINIGMSNGFMLSQTNDRYIDSDLDDNGPVYFGNGINDVRSHEEGLLIGLGGGSRSVSLEARFEVSNGFSPFSSLESTVHRFLVLAGYQF